MTTYQVRLNFDERVSRGPRAADVRRQLALHQPRLTRTDSGTEITLTVASHDLWLAVLIVMAAIKQLGYEPSSLTAVAVSEPGP